MKHTPFICFNVTASWLSHSLCICNGTVLFNCNSSTLMTKLVFSVEQRLVQVTRLTSTYYVSTSCIHDGQELCQLVSALCRIVNLVEASGAASFTTVQTIYLRIAEADCYVGTIAQKTQEQLDSEESIIRMDARGQEIVDCPGTQG
jgi:hypothetical protein